MPQTEKLETLEQALDKAINLLTERFGKADQTAAIHLASALYALQERERFNESRDDMADVPYQA
jgi:hypothetical protein